MAGVNLWPHQIEALEKIHNGSILTGDVGSGKSITAAAYFYTKVVDGKIGFGANVNPTPTKPRNVYVITTALKRDKLDWEKEFSAFAVSSDPQSSAAGIKLTVESWNNIVNFVDVKDAFFIFDEQRLVGSGAWVKAFVKIAKANQWIMLSATPGDNWMDYIPVFVANGFYKNRTEFIHKHVVYNNFSKFPKVDRYIETRHLQKLRSKILVDMPFERHTSRHIKNVLVEHDPFKFEVAVKQRWNPYEERPIRDVSELFSVMRKIVNTDPDRLEKMRMVMRKHPRVIIFYNFNYELDALREMLTEFEWLEHSKAEWNGHKHEPTPTSEKWVYLVQYTAGAEGWNCITTDTTVFYSLNYSYKINHQAMGRVDRLNTPYVDLWYYIFRSDSIIDKAIATSLSTKKSFNEKNFSKKIGAEKYEYSGQQLPGDPPR